MRPRSTSPLVARPALGVLVVAVCFADPQNPGAWEASGHRVVARIASEFLTPSAKAEVKRILQDEDFVAASTWADQIIASRPDTATWHVVRIPMEASTIDRTRDCAGPNGCVADRVVALRRALTLPPRMAGPALQRESLKFLIHLVADLHQPLACVDRDGREVPVALGSAPDSTRTTLHALWTRDLVSRPGVSEDAYVQELLKDLAARPVPEEAFNTEAWATESHRLAVEVAYGYPGALIAPPAGVPVTLDSAYLARARAAIDRQLAIAGVRLARILNVVLGGPKRPDPHFLTAPRLLASLRLPRWSKPTDSPAARGLSPRLRRSPQSTS